MWLVRVQVYDSIRVSAKQCVNSVSRPLAMSMFIHQRRLRIGAAANGRFGV